MKLNEALSKVENYIVKSVNVEEFAAMKKMATHGTPAPQIREFAEQRFPS